MEWLTQEKHVFEVINHLKNPFSKEGLQELLIKLDRKPSELVRRNELIFKEARKEGKLTEDEILQLMVTHPKLIERPIVELNGKAVLARPIDVLEPFLHKELNRIIRK